MQGIAVDTRKYSCVYFELVAAQYRNIQALHITACTNIEVTSLLCLFTCKAVVQTIYGKWALCIIY